MRNIPFKKHVLICSSGTCNKEQDSQALRQAFKQAIFQKKLVREVKETPCNCFGVCGKGPNVIIYPDGVVYSEVKVEDVEEIVSKHLQGGEIVERLYYRGKGKG